MELAGHAGRFCFGQQQTHGHGPAPRLALLHACNPAEASVPNRRSHSSAGLLLSKERCFPRLQLSPSHTQHCTALAGGSDQDR